MAHGPANELQEPPSVQGPGARQGPASAVAEPDSIKAFQREVAWQRAKTDKRGLVIALVRVGVGQQSLAGHCCWQRQQQRPPGARGACGRGWPACWLVQFERCVTHCLHKQRVARGTARNSIMINISVRLACTRHQVANVVILPRAVQYVPLPVLLHKLCYLLVIAALLVWNLRARRSYVRWRCAAQAALRLETFVNPCHWQVLPAHNPFLAAFQLHLWLETFINPWHWQVLQLCRPCCCDAVPHLPVGGPAVLSPSLAYLLPHSCCFESADGAQRASHRLAHGLVLRRARRAEKQQGALPPGAAAAVAGVCPLLPAHVLPYPPIPLPRPATAAHT